MLREFYTYYRPHLRLFWVDFGCAVLSGLLELAFPLAVTFFIDDLLPRGDWTLTVAAAAFAARAIRRLRLRSLVLDLP